MVGGWFSRTFGSLAYRDYLVLTIGSQFAFLGFMMSQAAQGVVAFDLEGTNQAVGIVWTGMGGAMIFVAPFGGVIADRVSKRKLLLFGQTAIGLSFLATGILIVTDLMTVWLLALTALAMGLSFAFIGPARQAYVSELVPRHFVANAVALSQLGVTFARVIGPVLASGMIALAFIGTGGTYLFMAGLFVIVVATLSFLPPSRGGGEDEPATTVLAQLKDGVRHINERPRLRIITLSFMATVFVAWPHMALLPGLLESELGQPASQNGVMLGVSAAAGIVVGLIATGMVSGRYAWGMMLAMGALFGVGLVLLSIAPTYLVALLVMIPVGAGFMGFRLINNSLLLTEADPRYHGRVMSIVMMGFGAQGVASLPMGALADSIGVRTVLAGEGVGTMVIAVVATLFYLKLRGVESRMPAVYGPMRVVESRGATERAHLIE